MVTLLGIYCLYRPQVLTLLRVHDSYACKESSVDYVFHLWVLMLMWLAGSWQPQMSLSWLAAIGRGSDSCCARLRMLQVMSCVMLDSIVVAG